MAIVYIHRRLDVEDNFMNVFYVGIGKSEKRAKNTQKRKEFWNNIVNKHGYKIEITHKNVCWEEACSIEKYLISFYGRKDLGLGNLCNMTDGGDGAYKAVRSAETRNKISIASKIFMNNSVTKEKHSNSIKQAWLNPEIREKYIIALKKSASGRKDFQKKSTTDLWKNSEYRHKTSKAIKISLSDPLVKQKMSKKMKEYFSNPASRKKTSDAVKESCKREDVKLKYIKNGKDFYKKNGNLLKQSFYNYFSDPIKKERHKQLTIQAMKNPEVLAKIKKANSKIVHQLDLNGNFIKEFESTKAASKFLSIHATTIQRCCKNKNKISNGFKFIYINNKNESNTSN
jgi:hypothetical protein